MRPNFPSLLGTAPLVRSPAQAALKLGANDAKKLAVGIALLLFEEKGSQVFADDDMKQSLVGLATLVAHPRAGSCSLEHDRMLSESPTPHRGLPLVRTRGPRQAAWKTV